MPRQIQIAAMFSIVKRKQLYKDIKKHLFVGVVAGSELCDNTHLFLDTFLFLYYHSNGFTCVDYFIITSRFYRWTFPHPIVLISTVSFCHWSFNRIGESL